MSRVLTVILFALVLTASAPAATYYVSPSGTGDGTTEATPCSWSAWKAVDRTGDTCYFAADMDSTINGDGYWPAAQAYYAKYVQVYPSYSIGWRFANYERVFQWADQEIGVVGPVGIVEFIPNPTESDFSGTPKDIHGSMVDPIIQGGQGWHENGVMYDPAKNIALTASVSTPYTLTAGHSVVSTYGRTAAQIVIPNVSLWSAAVLHAVDAVPASLSFRPAYSGGTATKTIHAVSEVVASRLQNVAAVAGTPSEAAILSYIDRLWLEYVPGANGRMFRPTLDDGVLSTYGTSRSARFGEVACWLNTNAVADKTRVLYLTIQNSIDAYGCVTCGNSFARALFSPDNGGHGQSKMRWAFAGWMLNDATILASLQKTGDYYEVEGQVGGWPTDVLHTSESQIYRVQSKHIATPPWGIGRSAVGSTTGTVSVTNGSAIVTGSGTSWLSVSGDYNNYFLLASNWVPTDNMADDLDAKAYAVSSVDSDTQITLASPYTGTSTAGASYVLAGGLCYGHGSHVGVMYDGLANTLTYGLVNDSREYTQGDIGLPVWGIGYGYHAFEGVGGSGGWGAGGYTGTPNVFYQRYQPTGGQANSGNTLAALMMGMKSVWNHDAAFDYADRLLIVNDIGSQWIGDWTHVLWDTYRANYETVWVPKCHTPVPGHAATGVATSQTLSWYDGNGRVAGTSCNVYFGTDATPDETELVESASTDYAYTPTLAAGTTYYWRVDEVTAGGTYTGDVWSFTTEGSLATEYILFRSGL